MNDTMVRHGTVTVELFDADGVLKSSETVPNLITDAGDLYYATKCIEAVAPSSTSAPTPVTGMKLGTGTTTAAKASGGAALITYINASNQAFDATYPNVVNLGTTLGVNSVYRVIYAPGTATNTAITEVVIVNDSASNATSTAGNTIARSVFGAINKAAGDSLTITWSHKNLGA